MGKLGLNEHLPSDFISEFIEVFGVFIFDTLPEDRVFGVLFSRSYHHTAWSVGLVKNYCLVTA